MTKKFLCLVILLATFGTSEAAQRRLSVVIFPTINSTGLEVWESKYYPYSVLEQKMSEYLEELFKGSPLIDARVLNEEAMNRWLSSSRRGDDMAVQLELYQAIMKERHILATAQTGRAYVRIRIYDRAKVQELAVRNVRGTDQRYTFDSNEDVYWFDSAISGLGVPFEYGFDLFGLIKQDNKSSTMSRPTWDQFKSTSHWQSIKNAIRTAYKQTLPQIRTVIQSNEPDSEIMATDSFSTKYLTVGRILAPTATATRKRRDYIISLGGVAKGDLEPVRVGEVLNVMRSDTYVTVDPENPVVVLPKVVGKVKVIKVYDDNAIVRVVKDNKKEPITLKDIVVKQTGLTRR